MTKPLTRQDIRTLFHSSHESTTDCLRATVQSGIEYPDAVWLVTDALRLDSASVAEMEDSYENQI